MGVVDTTLVSAADKEVDLSRLHSVRQTNILLLSAFIIPYFFYLTFSRSLSLSLPLFVLTCIFSLFNSTFLSASFPFIEHFHAIPFSLNHRRRPCMPSAACGCPIILQSGIYQFTFLKIIIVVHWSLTSRFIFYVPFLEKSLYVEPQGRLSISSKKSPPHSLLLPR